MDIKPTTHGKLTYLLHSHTPINAWEADPGDIQDISVRERSILVDLTLPEDEARSHKSWDPKDGRVMVSIRDGDGITVYEHPVTIGDHPESITIGIRES